MDHYLNTPFYENTPNVKLNVSNVAGGDTVTTNLTVVAPPPDIPTAVDLSGSVTVGQTLILDPINAVGATGSGRYVSAVGAVTRTADGVATADTVAIINDGELIQLTADMDVEEVSFTYDLTNADGTATGTVTVTKQAEQQQGDGNLSISVRGLTTRTAPAGVFFSAVASGFGVYDHYFDVDYFWTFGDPGHYTNNDVDDFPQHRVYTVDGQTVIVRGPVTFLEDGITQHATPSVKGTNGCYEPGFGTTKIYQGPDSNVGQGPHAAHTFSAPGTYTVRCEARRRGQLPVIATRQITIENPNTVFSGNKTICVGSNFTGAPSGALQVGTVSEAFSAGTAGNTGGTVRILFRRGETFGVSGKPSGNFTKFQFGAYGPEGDGKPVITGSGGIVLNNGVDVDSELVIWGLHIKPSNYTPANPFGSSPSGTGVEKLGSSKATVWDCKITGARQGLKMGDNTDDFIISDVYITDWFNYGFFSNRQSGYTALLGYFAKQNPNTVVAWGKGDSGPYYPDHGPARWAATGNPTVLYLFDLMSNNTWGPNTIYQPCIRMGRTNTFRGPYAEEAVIICGRGFHGPMTGTGNANTTDDAKPRRYLFEAIRNLKQNETGPVFSPMVLGLAFRNCVIVISDTQAQTSGFRPVEWLKREEGGKGSTGNNDAPQMADFGVDLNNCTLVDLRSNTNMVFDTNWLQNGATTPNGSVLLPAHHLRVSNNVVHSNKADDPSDTNDGPYDTTLFDLASYDYPGLRFETITPIDTDFRMPNATFSLYELAAGSPAVNGATNSNSQIGNGQGLIAVRDFFGNVRGSTTSRGAFDKPGT